MAYIYREAFKRHSKHKPWGQTSHHGIRQIDHYVLLFILAAMKYLHLCYCERIVCVSTIIMQCHCLFRMRYSFHLDYTEFFFCLKVYSLHVVLSARSVLLTRIPTQFLATLKSFPEMWKRCMALCSKYELRSTVRVYLKIRLEP